MARRAASSEAAARKRPREAPNMPLAIPANHGARIFARVTYWAVIGAFGAVAFATVLRNTTRLDWAWGSNWWPM